MTEHLASPAVCKHGIRWPHECRDCIHEEDLARRTDANLSIGPMTWCNYCQQNVGGAIRHKAGCKTLTDAEQLIWPDGHMGEYEAGLKTPDDFAVNRWLYQPYDARRYTESGILKLAIYGTPVMWLTPSSSPDSTEKM